MTTTTAPATMMAARLDLVGGTEVAPGPRVAASWQRCAERGLAYDELAVPHPAYEADSRLLRSADPVLSALAATLTEEPVSIMLSDADGVVVSRRCADRSILTALDAVELAPGATYSEAAVGTNGFGLALADDRAGLVAGQDHYSTQLSVFTCAGSPVHDPATGRLAGALSLTTWSRQRHDLLLALACQTAMNIEAQLAGQSGASSVGQLDGYLQGIAARRTGRCSPTGPRLTALEQLERTAIVDALARCHGGVTEAARELGVSRATVYRRIRHYRIPLVSD